MAEEINGASGHRPRHARHMSVPAVEADQANDRTSTPLDNARQSDETSAYSAGWASGGRASDQPATPPRQLGTPESASVRSSLRMRLPDEGVGADSTSAWIPTTPDSDSPRPIGVDPAATGSFQRLAVGEGATITTRENAELGRTAAFTALRSDAQSRRIEHASRPQVKSRQTEVKHDRRIYVILAVLAVVVVAAGIFFLRRLTAERPQNNGSDTPALTQAEVGQSISFGGALYTLREQADGHFALTYQPEEGSAQTLCTLEGRPVQLFLYNGFFVMPENLGGSWDVMAYTRSDGSMVTAVVGEDGEPVGGEGAISTAALSGSTLTLTLESGELVDVNLG